MKMTGPGKRTSAYTAKPKKKKKKKPVSGYHLLGGVSAEAAEALNKGRYKYK